MIYGSVCSGIEAATVAWHPLGWRSAFFSEIEKFPRAILTHHYPTVPLHGDFTTIEANNYEPIDLLVGGTPCQDFSVAGLRAGLAGDRGNLTLEFIRLVARLRPRWIVWENVPGVLSDDDGRAFGAILGGLGVIGYGFAYRILDAQYAGLAQRRERVFVVGYLGDWRPPAAVLFESESLCWNPPPVREAGKGVTGGTSRRPDSGHVVNALTAHNGHRNEIADAVNGSIIPVITGALNAVSGNAYPGQTVQDASAGFLLPIAFGAQNSAQQGDSCSSEMSPTLDKSKVPAVAFKIRQGCDGGGKGYLGSEELSFTVSTHQDQSIHSGMAVRRLTPRECERLQGFPDDYTLIPYRGRMAADGPRYKALGNSMAVPVMKWIGERINLVAGLMS